MEWFEELGFTENPFDTDASFSARFSAGLESQMEELDYLVKSASFVFVQGEPGSGKSVLLRLLAEKLGGRALFIDASSGADIRSAVKSKVSIFGSLFGKSPKNLVVLVDNASALSPDAFELIKFNYDNNIFTAVFLAGSSLKTAKLPASIVDRIGSRVVSIPALSEDAALMMARRRMGASELLDDAALRKIYKTSGGNARKFLQLCEEAARSLHVKVGEING